MPQLNEQRQERRDEFNRRVGQNINTLRLRRGIPPGELAEFADMDMSKLYRIEAGERSISFAEAIAIAKELGVSLQYLCYEKLRAVSA